MPSLRTNKRIVILVVVAALVLLVGADAQAEKDQYDIWSSFATNPTSLPDVSEAELIADRLGMLAYVEKQLGKSVVMHLAPRVGMVLEKFETGEAEIGYLSYADYFVAIDAGVPIKAMASPTFVDTNQQETCIWGRKELEGRELRELKGMSCGFAPIGDTDLSKWKQATSFSALWNYFTFRWLLAENGVDMPIQEFCGPLEMELATQELALMAVASGALDLAPSASEAYNSLSRTSERMNALAPLFCGPSGPRAAFVMHSNSPESAGDFFADTFGGRSFSEEFPTMSKAFYVDRLTRVTDEDYRELGDWFHECLERGYLDEFEVLKTYSEE